MIKVVEILGTRYIHKSQENALLVMLNGKKNYDFYANVYDSRDPYKVGNETSLDPDSIRYILYKVHTQNLSEISELIKDRRQLIEVIKEYTNISFDREDCIDIANAKISYTIADLLKTFAVKEVDVIDTQDDFRNRILKLNKDRVANRKIDRQDLPIMFKNLTIKEYLGKLDVNVRYDVRISELYLGIVVALAQPSYELCFDSCQKEFFKTFKDLILSNNDYIKLFAKETEFLVLNSESTYVDVNILSFDGKFKVYDNVYTTVEEFILKEYAIPKNLFVKGNRVAYTGFLKSVIESVYNKYKLSKKPTLMEILEGAQ